MTRLTPSRASAMAIARPMPEAAPVTNAVRPRKTFIAWRYAPLLRFWSNNSADGRSGGAGEFPGHSAGQAAADPFSRRRRSCTPLGRGQRQHLISDLLVEDLLEPRQRHTDIGGVGGPVGP